MPSVSVIIPIYNRSKYLHEAVNSVLQQSYKDFEIIIVNDGSTDNTEDVIRELSREYSGVIRSLSSPVNKGTGAARNIGIQHSKGEFIAFLDSDDQWLPGRLEKAMSLLNTGKYDWVDSPAIRMELNSRDEVLDERIIRNETFQDAYELRLGLFCRNMVGETSRVTVRKKCLEAVGGFSENIPVAEDWELWIRLAKLGCRFYRIDEPLCLYKVRRNNTTQSPESLGLRSHYKIIKMYYKDAVAFEPLMKKKYAEILWDLSRRAINRDRKDYGLAVKCAIKSQLLQPSLGRVMKSMKTYFGKAKQIEEYPQHLTLMYHGVIDEKFVPPKDREVGADLYDVHVKNFRSQLEILRQKGYSVTTSSNGYVKGVLSKKCIITFDDGELNNYSQAFPVLKEFGYPAYFFIIGERVGRPGYMGWSELKALHDGGMVIGSHGLTHAILTNLRDEQVEEELRASKKYLERNLNITVDSLSIPRGFCDDRVLQIAYNLGYKTIFVSEKHGGITQKSISRIALKTSWSNKKFQQALLGEVTLKDRTTNVAKRAVQFVLRERGYNYIRRMMIQLWK